jgi:hypothetical protein
MERFHPTMHRRCHPLGMTYVQLIEAYRKHAQDDTDQYVAEAHGEWLKDCLLAGFDPTWRDYSRYVHKS